MVSTIKMVEFPLLCWLTGVFSIFVGCIYVWNIPIVSGWRSMSLFERNHVLRFKWGHDLSQAFFCMIVLIGSFNYLRCWFLQVLVNQYRYLFHNRLCLNLPSGFIWVGKFSMLEGWKVGGRLFNGVWFTSSTTMNSPSDPMDLRNFWNWHLRTDVRNTRRNGKCVVCHQWMHEHSWMPCSNLATGDMKLKSYEHVTERDPRYRPVYLKTISRNQSF